MRKKSLNKMSEEELKKEMAHHRGSLTRLRKQLDKVQTETRIAEFDNSSIVGQWFYDKEGSFVYVDCQDGEDDYGVFYINRAQRVPVVCRADNVLALQTPYLIVGCSHDSAGIKDILEWKVESKLTVLTKYGAVPEQLIELLRKDDYRILAFVDGEWQDVVATLDHGCDALWD